MKVVWTEGMEVAWQRAQFEKWRQRMPTAQAATRRPVQPVEPPVSPIRRLLIRRFGSELALEAAIVRQREAEREAEREGQE